MAFMASLAWRSHAGRSRAALAATMRGVRTMASDSASFELRTPFAAHLCDGPSSGSTEATKDELLDVHRTMYTIRRMEIANDTEYKNRAIRGFCHLYDGQEAVATGVQNGLDKRDDVIQTYRCHAYQLVRGDTVDRIVAELFGFQEGSSAGKGGSMHFYSKKNRFWGGAGIVGAQVPVGVGLGFANKYLNKGKWPAPVSLAIYGDGAANQGQCWESANMAKLWDLPVIFMCENNEYGMGTAVSRSSANTDYYKQGGVVIPGVRCDGMDYLSVRDAIRYCKEWAGSGKGPIYLEAKTYRYHGHSMSDPGVSYRGREEVNEMRRTKDCIELIKSRILEAGFATEADLKSTEKKVRAEVSEAIEKARSGSEPPPEELYTDIFHNEIPQFIRGVESTTSFRPH